jgi:rhodanese-related sulfurtransferase
MGILSLTRLGCIVLAVCANLGIPPQHLRAEERTLSTVVRDVSTKHRTLAHMTPAELAGRLSKPDDLVLIDVREESEYAVSHLSGAIRVDPGIWRSTFLSRYREALKGKTVVFYCSVGVRSSALADNVKEDLLAAGVREVVNLEGGIFAWHNQSRPLVDKRGQTSFVHPYDAYWGRLLTRPELARTIEQP